MGKITLRMPIGIQEKRVLITAKNWKSDKLYQQSSFALTAS